MAVAALRALPSLGGTAVVDYAGTTLEVSEPATGKAMTAQLFVAVLGASNYTYAEATWRQGLSDNGGQLPDKHQVVKALGAVVRDQWSHFTSTLAEPQT